MRIFLVASTVFLVTGSPFGPQRNVNDVLPSKTNSGCSSIDGCSHEGNIQFSASKFSSSDSRFSQDKPIRGNPYWWEGQNNPFKGGCTPGRTGCLNSISGKGLLPSGSTNTAVVNRFESAGGLSGSQCVCPSFFACVHWQFCQDGVMIVDGSASIDHTNSIIPEQVSAAFGSCGKNMICCRIPTCENVGQVSNFQTSNKFSPSIQNQNIHESHFSSTQYVDDSQSNFGVGIPLSSQDSSKFPQPQAFASPEKQKETHFSEISIDTKNPTTSSHDSINSDHIIQAGSFHSSQKIPGIQEIAPELAIFSQTTFPERAESEAEIDEIPGHYLPPSSTFFSEQSQIQENIHHKQQDFQNQHQQKQEIIKLSKPSVPEQGTKLTSPQLISYGKPDQTVQFSSEDFSSFVHKSKQSQKPSDNDEEKRPFLSADTFNTNSPLTPQLAKPVIPTFGDSHVLTPQAGAGSTGQVSIKIPAHQNHKFGDVQKQESTLISGHIGPTIEIKFPSGHYKPEVPAQHSGQQIQSGKYEHGHVEQVPSTFISDHVGITKETTFSFGQTDKSKETKFPTNQYQHSILSPAEIKPTKDASSFHSQSQQHHSTDDVGSSSFISKLQGSQFESGHSQISIGAGTGKVNAQGRPDSTFISGLSGISNKPTFVDLNSHSQATQQHITGSLGSSSFDSGRPGNKFQTGQSDINVGAEFHQPSNDESTNTVIQSKDSINNLHGTAISTFDRGTHSTGVISGTGTQSPGMGGMMMMMGPMLVGGKMMVNGEVMTTVSGNPLISGSCSAGQFCLPKSDCNPYNGFIILYANQQVAASFPNAPKVPLLGCHIGGISDSESFCCQLPHPLLGPDGKPFD